MKLQRALCGIAMGIAAIILVIFALDLSIGLFFETFSWSTDVLILIACSLLLWQGYETWRGIG